MTFESHYDVIVIGTGFASTFFLHNFLKNDSSVKKILVLEKGAAHSLSWQRQHDKNSNIDHDQQYIKKGIDNKGWRFTMAFGGSSNCWTGCTPRMMPNDFRMKTQYGVGYDWPISYEELEPYYVLAENIMAISGPDDWTLSQRSAPYPQPAHNLSLPDKILKKAYPSHYYPQATARARIATHNRPACCASAQCDICPIGAKFTIQNEMQYIYDDPRVELYNDAEVRSLTLNGSTVSSATFKHDGNTYKVNADLFILGANGMFNPYLLKVSGDTHPLLGKRLHEQVATAVTLDLDGIDNFQGSTFIPGQGFMFYDGEHRREYGACMTENLNFVDMIRPEFGKWRQVMKMVFIVEDLPLDTNYVDVGSDEKPLVVFNEYSNYGLKGLQQVPRYIEELKQILPIEQVHYTKEFLEQKLPRPTESHIQGTVVMGNTGQEGVIDKHLVHHRYRNLLVLGSSAFPTGAPANPTLTLSAMSLMAAEHIT